MDYWEQDFVIVCELCAGGHYTHRCEYNRNRPNFSWDYNQSGMEQAQYPSFPLQNQQFGYEPYSPGETQQQQGQQFQHQYASMHQHFQPPEFQQQQFQTWSNQQSTEEAELEELRLMAKSNALSLQRIGDQIGQIANALKTLNQIASDTEGLAVEEEDKNMPISLDWPFLATGETLIEVHEGESEGKDEESDCDSEVDAFEGAILETDTDVLQNFCQELVQPHQSEEESGLLNDEDIDGGIASEPKEDVLVEELKATINEIDIPPLYSQGALEGKLYYTLTDFGSNEEGIGKRHCYPNKPSTEKEKAGHGELRITVPWIMGLRVPHKLLGVEDLWNSQVRLKPSFEGAPELELKPLLVHLGYVSCNSSPLLAIVFAANFSGRRENVVKRSYGERIRVKLVVGEVAPEKILKWPL